MDIILLQLPYMLQPFSFSDSRRMIEQLSVHEKLVWLNNAGNESVAIVYALIRLRRRMDQAV